MDEKENTATLEKQEVPQTGTAAPSPAPDPSAARVETLLRRLEEQSVLQTKLAKNRLSTAVFAVALMLLAGRVIPAVERTLTNANTTLLEVTTLAQQLEGADIPAILDNLDQTLTESRASLAEASEAVQAVSSIDFESLNQAILDLKRLVENPLGSLFGR